MRERQAVWPFFSEEEALTKVGKRIQTGVEFSGVPRGSVGRVIRADRATGGFDLAIAWDLPSEVRAFRADPTKPLVDWFTKDEYERFLDELEDEPAR
jgi:hypothetical protein